MGTWGVAIFSDDLASGLRDSSFTRPSCFPSRISLRAIVA